ncbi:MAG: hypothetical protein M1837_002177 [Sclerophora amabilis]|nr:MAG: hypothetical protein M1837_002177 [Sclerophora amabilis]
MPVLLSSPESNEDPSLPFKFTGGLALPTKTIGLIMSFQGVYSMIAQISLFPMVVRRFGPLAVFRFVTLLYPILYFVVPYVTLLPKPFQMIGVYFCLVLKVTAAVLAYPSNAILLTNSAPSNLVLGAINGIAASTASLSRALGPTVSGLIHSMGLQMGYSGLAWWSSALVSILGAVECFWMAEVDGRLDKDNGTTEDTADVFVDQMPSQDPVEPAMTVSIALPTDRRTAEQDSIQYGRHISLSKNSSLSRDR